MAEGCADAQRRHCAQWISAHGHSFYAEMCSFQRDRRRKNVKYKNETIKSLVVKNCFGDGKEATFIPIKLYWSDQKK